MRTLFIPLLLSVVLPADAARLKVQLLVTPGYLVRQGVCPGVGATNPEAPLTGTNNYSVSPYVERNYPGAVELKVSGGVPPYRYDWHGLMDDASVCSVMPGMVRVTVTDAVGNSITRSVNVGTRIKLLPSPCGDFPLTENDRLASVKPQRMRIPRAMNEPRGVRQVDHRNEVQRIPLGPAGGGRGSFKPVAVPSDRVVR